MTHGRILIAERDIFVRKMCEDYFFVRGLNVFSYGSGEESLEELGFAKLIRRNYDRLLTGFILDGRMNGLELTEKVVKEFGIPVFMMSGSEIEKEAMAAGATGYISKPFEMHDLDAVFRGL
ncbi:MAG TPA: response regulator [Candidatus Omnitrophota bacterium]|nr:response regulator [Candidatus Omnitrophota bacterium]